MASQRRRIEIDVQKLFMSHFDVTLVEDSLQEFFVQFPGPVNTPFAGGMWKVRVELPDGYPYKSPSIGFINKIFHPNIDEMSGSVCLDVINQTWSAMYELLNVFEIFLPQLLAYPNSRDPLNGEAASLHTRDPKAYENKVKDYVRKFATPEAPAIDNNPLSASPGTVRAGSSGRNIESRNSQSTSACASSQKTIRALTSPDGHLLASSEDGDEEEEDEIMSSIGSSIGNLRDEDIEYDDEAAGRMDV